MSVVERALDGDGQYVALQDERDGRVHLTIAEKRDYLTAWITSDVSVDVEGMQ